MLMTRGDPGLPPGADSVAESNVVDRHIRNLRLKLENHSVRPSRSFADQVER